MRSYWQLLRLPYQFQLGPIFGWGYLLAGGRLHTGEEVLRFLLIFLCFHVGCFGGLTALNSYYDRDRTPVGGMWQPPAPPRHLFWFAWLVQSAGAVPLLFIDLRLAVIYIVIGVLATGYSHPRVRWKGRALSSLTVVALGQGVLDFSAGVLAASPKIFQGEVLLPGMIGVAAMVCAFYPLTQLFQTENDKKRGDQTVALQLLENGDRRLIFRWTIGYGLLGAACNALALIAISNWPDAMLFIAAGCAISFYVFDWQRAANISPADDFRRVHLLLRVNALAFGLYLLVRLCRAPFNVL